MNLEIKNSGIKILRIGCLQIGFRVRDFLTADAVLFKSLRVVIPKGAVFCALVGVILCALPVAHANTCEDMFARETGKAVNETREANEDKETREDKKPKKLKNLKRSKLISSPLSASKSFLLLLQKIL